MNRRGGKDGTREAQDVSRYSEQDLEYAAEFREGVHREALAIIRKTRPNATEVIDRHPVEDYFQEHWDYPGKWYTVVAIPHGYGSRKALIDAIVRDTLSGRTSEAERADTQELRDAVRTEAGRRALANGLLSEADYGRLTAQQRQAREAKDDPFYRLLDEYPDLVVEYCIVENESRYFGYESHRRALKTAYGRLCGNWEGDPAQAVGTSVAADTLFSSAYQDGTLNYRRAFLYPPHENGYTGKDFVRVNAALFPKGTDELAVYAWTTDWSAYFDEGHEWWGALCLTVYDERMDRFVVILASATD